MPLLFFMIIGYRCVWNPAGSPYFFFGFIPMIRLLLALYLVFCALPAHAEKRVALVIGNSNYSALSKLAGPVNDAVDVEKALRDLGYQIVPPPRGKTHSVNLSRDEMLGQIDALRNAAQDAQLVLLYYSGHGVQIDGENRLLPVNLPDKTTTRLRNDGLKLSEVLTELQSGMPEGSSAVVVLDACRDTGAVRGSKGMVSIAPKSGFFVAFATAEGQTAEDLGPSQRNSPYTEAFLTELKHSAQQPISGFFIQVRNRVIASGADQTPNNVLGLNDAQIALAGRQVGVATAAPTARADVRVPVVEEKTPSKAQGGTDDVDINTPASLRIGKLMWRRSDNGKDSSLRNGMAHCSGFGAGWRLPSSDEVRSIYSEKSPYAFDPKGGYILEVKPSQPEFELTGTFLMTSDAAKAGRVILFNMGTGKTWEYFAASSYDMRALCVCSTCRQE